MWVWTGPFVSEKPLLALDSVLKPERPLVLLWFVVVSPLLYSRSIHAKSLFHARQSHERPRQHVLSNHISTHIYRPRRLLPKQHVFHNVLGNIKPSTEYCPSSSAPPATGH